MLLVFLKKKGRKLCNRNQDIDLESKKREWQERKKKLPDWRWGRNKEEPDTKGNSSSSEWHFFLTVELQDSKVSVERVLKWAFAVITLWIWVLGICTGHSFGLRQQFLGRNTQYPGANIHWSKDEPWARTVFEKTAEVIGDWTPHPEQHMLEACKKHDP